MILNSVLGINLTLAEDCVISVHDQNIRFRKYSFEAEEVEEKIQLFVNKNNGYYLFNELKKIDYFLLIQTEANIAGLEKALQNLKNTPGISVLSKLDPGSLRSLSKII